MPVRSSRWSSPGVRRTSLAMAVLATLWLPAAATAQTAKEVELEARVAELERMVQQLVSRPGAEADAIATAASPGATPAATPASTTKPAIQSAPIMPAATPGTAFSYGGFVKFDAMLSDTTGGEIADGSAGRMFYLPSAIPVGGAAEAHADTDTHAQFSRFWFSADTTLDSGDALRAYLEMDFFGGGSNALLGNEVATNTHGVAIRHAYVQWNRWLAGQTWSNFQDTAALPDSVDFIGPTEGTVFVRQAQLRYTRGAWSFSAENPETTVTAYRGAGARISSDDNLMPDLTARWTRKRPWGHVTAAALLREFRYDNPATGVADSARGGAISVSGRYLLGANDDLRFMATGGRGVGRYLGLGIASDTVLAADGSLEPIDGVGGFVAWRHAFSPKLRGNVFYSFARFDHDAALTGPAVTRGAQSWHANLIYSPLPRLDVGAELIWGQRTLENDADGELRRLHTHVKYSF